MAIRIFAVRIAAILEICKSRPMDHFITRNIPILNKMSKGAQKKNSGMWSVASHSDVISDTSFAMAAILDFHMQG